MTKGEQVEALFFEGYNCSQAVFAAFAPDFGMDIDTAMRLSEGLGGGMGRMREVCGAVGSAVLILSLKCGTASPDPAAKKRLYRVIQAYMADFRERKGSYICKELLADIPDAGVGGAPSERTADFYKKRPCASLIRDAAELLSKYLSSDEITNDFNENTIS